MYNIVKCPNHYLCVVNIQDGEERWMEKTEHEAVAAVIQSARVLNGTYITRADIYFSEARPQQDCRVSDEDYRLLQDIKSGQKVVLDCQDKRIKYKITDDDCDFIVRKREKPATWIRQSWDWDD